MEFRSAVMASGRDFAAIAAATGLSVRAMKAYWHGERPVPGDVAEYLATGVHPGRSDRPPVGSESPNYAEVRRLRREVQMSRTELSNVLNAVDAMCRACEPELKACRDAECPLRPVSPFGLHSRPFGKPAVGAVPTGETGAVWPPTAAGYGGRGHVSGVVETPKGGEL